MTCYKSFSPWYIWFNEELCNSNCSFNWM